MMGQVAHGKALPAEVVEQVVAKTDGVPLFVEELTKMVLESGLLQEREERYELTGPLPPLAIPTTLHDSLMARLDRLATVKGLAQLGATLGREFSYELLLAVSPWDEGTLQRGLHQLVEAEFVYQRGLPPQATYVFKHALIQDVAYQSLLRSTRQRYHQRIAQVLAERFPETAETQPELLAHHYTEAGLREQAMPYWQHAGQRALQRSANLEAVSHVTRGLEVLSTLPETRERAHQELALQIMLGAALGAIKGQMAPEAERTYARACALARQVGSPPELFPALWGFCYAHMARGQLPRARELAEEFLELARQQQDLLLLAAGHRMLGEYCLVAGRAGPGPGPLPARSGLLRPGAAPRQRRELWPGLRGGLRSPGGADPLDAGLSGPGAAGHGGDAGAGPEARAPHEPGADAPLFRPPPSIAPRAPGGPGAGGGGAGAVYGAGHHPLWCLEPAPTGLGPRAAG